MAQLGAVPRAIAIDLDGTLLNSKTQLSERNRAALLACAERGIPMVIATSRPARAVHRILDRDLLERTSLILMNGAVARGASPLAGQVREVLPRVVIERVVEMVRSLHPDARTIIELDGYRFGASHILPPAQLCEINSATPDMVMSLQDALAHAPTKVAVNGMGENLSRLAVTLTRELSGAVAIFPADGNTFLNIVSPLASKSQALAHLLQPAGISLADVIAFGDDLPDLDLLTACGTSIAMANAVTDIQAVARYLTSSNDDDGVAEVLEQVAAMAAAG